MMSHGTIQEGVSVTRRTEVVTEVRLVETNEAFKNISDCLDWIQNKQSELEGAGFGSDLETSRQAQDVHQAVHREITDFKTEVNKCMAAKVGHSYH